MENTKEARKRLQDGLVVGLVVGLVFGLVYGLVFGLIIGLTFGLTIGLVVGITTQIIAFFSPELVFLAFDFWSMLILLIIIQIIGWSIVYKLGKEMEDE